MLQLGNSVLIGAETSTLRKADLKYFGSFEVRCWGMEKISWAERVRNDIL